MTVPSDLFAVEGRPADRELGRLDSDAGLGEAAGRRRAVGRLSVAREERRR